MGSMDTAASLERNAPDQFARYQLLGCMLKRGDLFGLTPEHFVGYQEARNLFLTLQVCLKQGLPLTNQAVEQIAIQEGVSISEDLRIARACEVLDDNPAPAIALVKRDRFLSDMTRVASSIESQVAKLRTSLVPEKFAEFAAQTIDEVSGSFMKLSNQSGLPELPFAPVGRTDPMQVVEESREIYRTEDEDNYSGFPLISRLINMGESVHTIAAPTGLGKTAFVLKEAYHTARSGRPVLYASTEMPEEAVIKRILAIENPKVPLEQLFKRQLIDLHLDQTQLSVRRLFDLPFFYIDGLVSVREIKEAAIRLDRYLRTGATVVQGHSLNITEHRLVGTYIDFLQQTDLSAYPGNNRDTQITHAMIDVRRGASATHGRWVAVSQMNREHMKRKKGAQPQLSDLRESGAIEQQSDCISFLHRESYYDDAEEAVSIDDDQEDRVMDERDKTWYVLRKNRNGRNNVMVPLRFVAKRACYFEAARGTTDAYIDEEEEARQAAKYHYEDSFASDLEGIMGPPPGADPPEDP